MGWKDRKYERIETVVPFIQWVNDGASLEPRSEGGFGQPLDQAALLGATIPGVLSVLHHKGGKTTDMVVTPELEVAVLTTRFGWIKDGAMIDGYVPGARGKLQALCVVRDVGGNPTGLTMLTFTGLAGSEFNAALSLHRETVRKATTAQAPAYAFFGRFRSGEIKMVGSNGAQSPITTIEYADGFDPDVAFVGDQVLDGLNWDQIEAWESAWQNGGNGNDTDDASGNGDSPKPRNPDAPASEAQTGLIRRLMSELGIKGEDKQDKALRKQTGYDPAALTMAQASEVIERLVRAKKKQA